MRKQQDLDFQLKVIHFCGIGIAICYILAVVFDRLG
jgi:hypothetical protein